MAISVVTLRAQDPASLSKDSLAAGETWHAYTHLRDTSFNNIGLHTHVLTQEEPDLALPLSLKTLPPDIPSSLQMAMILTLPAPSATLRANTDIASALKQDLAKQAEYRTLKTILSSIEMSGAAYLAYLHIREYGLQ